MSYVADQTRWSSQHSPRTGPITRFVWHHQASTNDDATIDMMVSGARQVSATWTINNDNPGGRGHSRITAVVPEDRRPWTTSSATVDGPALTVECANSTGAPGWGIADASIEAAAELAAYAHEAYGVPLRRITSPADTSGHIGHNECLAIWPNDPGLYATACQMNLDIDRILTRAAELLGETPPEPLPKSSVLELGMFLLATSGGVILLGAGYQKNLGQEEWQQISQVPGIVTMDVTGNQRAVDVIVSACMNGASSPPAGMAGAMSASAPPIGDLDDTSEH